MERIKVTKRGYWIDREFRLFKLREPAVEHRRQVKARRQEVKLTCRRYVKV